MITVRGKIGDGINDFIRGMHKLKIDDYIEIDVYTNVVEATIHGVSGILWISISTQVENNLKNK
jgi:hypothetical protein